MLSKTTKLCLVFSIQLAFYACTMPIRWSAKKRCVIFVKSKLHLVFCLLSFSLMVFYESFLIFRLFQAFYLVHHGAHVRHIIQISYFVCTYGIPIHLQITTFSRWRDIPALLNSFLAFYEMFKRHFMIPKNKPIKNGCEGLLKTFYVLAFLINLQNAAILLRNPDKSFFLSSLLPQPRKLTMIQRIPFLCLHGYIWIAFWSHVLFYGHLMYTYTFPGLFILQQMQFRMGFAAFTCLLHISTLLRKLGRFFEMSGEVLRSWAGQTKFIDKVRKSCRPLSVKVGCYYVIKLSTVLSVWGFVINTTITLLLM